MRGHPAPFQVADSLHATPPITEHRLKSPLSLRLTLVSSIRAGSWVDRVMTNKLDYRRYQSAVSMFSQIQESIRARQAHIVKPKHRHPCSSGQVLSLCLESRNLKGYHRRGYFSYLRTGGLGRAYRHRSLTGHRAFLECAISPRT